VLHHHVADETQCLVDRLGGRRVDGSDHGVAHFPRWVLRLGVSML
jgi:hypothetical protein